MYKKSDKSHDLSNVLILAIDLRLSAKIGKLFHTATTRSQKKMLPCINTAMIGKKLPLMTTRD